MINGGFVNRLLYGNHIHCVILLPLTKVKNVHAQTIDVSFMVTATIVFGYIGTLANMFQDASNMF